MNNIIFSRKELTYEKNTASLQLCIKCIVVNGPFVAISNHAKGYAVVQSEKPAQTVSLYKARFIKTAESIQLALLRLNRERDGSRQYHSKINSQRLFIV